MAFEIGGFYPPNDCHCKNGWNGWLEDRRGNAAADPYKVVYRIIKTVKTVPEYAVANGR